MANEDSVTVSFRLNLNREEDWEIHRYLENEKSIDKDNSWHKAGSRGRTSCAGDEFTAVISTDFYVRRNRPDYQCSEADYKG